MKEAGVIGAEVEITGKLSGNRGRTEKFSFGYVKRCGNTSKENVQKGYQLARTKPGAIGVKVRVMKEMPDFMHRDVDYGKSKKECRRCGRTGRGGYL
ncbi:30S ribosomal protein S3P [Candidatus Haloredivivus sp. G17]|nr:30S ribosomal protein S3P [Candidatus Haloredivivus sp. G17]